MFFSNKKLQANKDRIQRCFEDKFPNQFYWQNAELDSKHVLSLDINWFAPVTDKNGFYQRQRSLEEMQETASLFVDVFKNLGIQVSVVEGFRGTPRMTIDTTQTNFEFLLDVIKKGEKRGRG